jgi:hypothetical protein
MLRNINQAKPHKMAKIIRLIITFNNNMVVIIIIKTKSLISIIGKKSMKLKPKMAMTSMEDYA